MSYNNGLPQYVDHNKRKEMARDFAEGNSALEKLLLTAWKRGVNTHACCNGHLVDFDGMPSYPYIDFVLNEEDYKDFATLLICKFQGKEQIWIDLIQRDLDELYANDENFKGRQYNINVTFKNITDENLKSFYYSELTTLIRDFEVLKTKGRLTESFQKVHKKIQQIVKKYDFDNISDNSYCNFCFTPNSFLNNFYQISKSFTNGVTYYKFFHNEEILMPKNMSGYTLKYFLDAHKFIEPCRIGSVSKYDPEEMELEE